MKLARFDVDVHFNPDYDPWDQRLCLIPDDDLWEALKSDRASVVTDTIERFTESGIELSSGEHLDADLIVTATGLKLQFLGGAELVVDGETKQSSELVSYRGMMLGDCPNWVAIIGYTAASWTLKADLTADWVCRLLDFMDAHGFDTVVPALPRAPMDTESALANLNSGYVKRAADVIPQQGQSVPWRNRDSYPQDWLDLRLSGFDDGVLRFTRPDAEATETPRRRKRDRLKALVRRLRPART